MKDGKLVRDRIPELIRANGEEPVVCRAEGTEYWERLREKLREEVGQTRGVDEMVGLGRDVL